jgi:hypothetical protein
MTLRVRSLAICLLLALPLLVLASAPPVPGDDLGALLGLVTKVLALAGSAKVFGAGLLALMAGIWAVRRFVPAGTAAGEFIRSSEGGTILNLLGSAAFALLTNVLTGGALSWAVVVATFIATAGGTGALWSMGRSVLRLLIPLVGGIPWLASVLRWLTGAGVKAQVIKAADAEYKAKVTTAKAAAAELGR